MAERSSGEDRATGHGTSVSVGNSDEKHQNTDEMVTTDATDAAETKPTGPEYPGPSKRAIIMISLYLSMFLIILDQNILSTAIPRITDEFQSIDDIAWYGSAYILTTCAFQLLMGKVYRYYPAKPVFLAGISLFEVGSIICGAAPNSTALIIGRAIAGMGGSGLFSGVMVIMANTIPLQERPAWQGGIGGILAIGSVVGPLLGGVFTDEVTWRWCFYINLPIGAVTIFVAIFFLKLSEQKLDTPADTWLGKFKQLDPLGNLCFFPGTICLILALQWGGTTYAWSDARIIVLFIIFGIMTIAFVGIQIWKQDEGTVPPRLFKQRSIAGASLYSFFVGAGLVILPYYIPIWFQAVKNASALESGIMLLPTFLATVIGTLSSGFIVSKIGYYTPFFLISSILMPLGTGLMSLFTPSTGAGEWIGYQVLLGLGFGFGVQQPLNVVQNVLKGADIATGAALVTFVRFFASAIFLPMAQNIFVKSLVDKLTNLPGVDVEAVTGGGATDLRKLAGNDEELRQLVSDYNGAFVNVAYIGAGTCAASMLGSLLIEWRSVKRSTKAQTPDAKAENGEAAKTEDVEAARAEQDGVAVTEEKNTAGGNVNASDGNERKVPT